MENSGSAARTQRKIGIIGHRLSHTMSPAMHTAAFREKNLDFVYGVFDVNEEMLPPLLMSLKKRNFRGANVTVPYKQTVIPYLDAVSEEASSIGAVNTIVNNNGRLEGYNTDAFGVFASLLPFKERIEKKEIVILGAGGGARSAIYIIAKHFSPYSITIVNRTIQNAAAVAVEFEKKFAAIRFSGIAPDAEASKTVDRAALIVNTTTVGMKPNENILPLPVSSVLKNSHIVFDIIYNPLETMLLKKAKEAGATTISGMEMLLGQGVKAFELFTGNDFPVEVAREAVLKELKGRR
jgi:shikimate dehydrogenase